MTETRHDIVAIGNAIVDIISRCDDAFLDAHGCPKGNMALVDAPTIERLYDASGPAVEASGGSAANTMVGAASFGSKAGFIGKVAQDDFGRIFSHDLNAAGVTYTTPPAADGSEPTARSLVLVTPDGERTMNTFLGVSPELDHGEVDATMIENAGILYLEGYLFDRPEAKAAFRSAAQIATKADTKTALTLSDAFCVGRHRAEFLELVKDEVDILFANEEEIVALYEAPSFDAAVELAVKDTHLAALTRGAKGSLILCDGQVIEIPVIPVDKVVDTTGAGDLYAAGLLHGIAAGVDLETAGRLGSIAAAEIISHIGARPEENLLALAKDHGINI